MDRIVEMIAPITIAAKTASDCWVLNLWETEKTSGIEPNVKYSTAQAKATHKEKKKTTGSVMSR